jgi:hypothetical protein
MISGYPSELYDRELAGWSRVTFDMKNHAAGGKTKGREVEAVWANFALAAKTVAEGSP